MKKSLKKFFIIVGCLVLLVVGLPILSMYVKHWRGMRTDTYYLRSTGFLYENLEIIKTERKNYADQYDKFQEAPYFRVSLHRLKAVSGSTVLIIRSYTPDRPMVLDGDHYRKITVQLNELKSENVNLKDRDDVKVLFTDGGASWPRNGCTQMLKEGTLNIAVAGESVQLNINAEAYCQSYGEPAIKISETFLLKELDFSKLNPWLGSVGDHPYSETKRHSFW